MTELRDATARTWWRVLLLGAVLLVVGTIASIALAAASGRMLATTLDDLTPVEESEDLLAGMEAGRTLHLFAPADAGIVHGTDAIEASGGEAGGDAVDDRPPQGWPGGCEFEGPDLSLYHSPQNDAPIEVDGVRYEPILVLMNGAAQGAVHTMECEADGLLIGTQTSTSEFRVDGPFWPAFSVGATGLLVTAAGAIGLAARRGGVR